MRNPLSLALGLVAAILMGTAPLGANAQATGRAELHIGIATFMSGAGAVQGIPAKAGAELWIEQVNAAGGIGGARLVPHFMDEGLGTEKLLSEYRRLIQEQGVKVMFAAISSGTCNTVAPVAEDLKVLNVMWNCGTEKLLEERRYKYVFRTVSNAEMEMVSAAIHLLRVRPNVKTVTVVNQDYSWGRDSWEMFRRALLALKPDVKIVAELFPRFGAPDYSTEITRLQALKPEVVVSTAWGGDLDTLIRQATQRGLHKTSQWLLPIGEGSIERLGKSMPDGVMIGMRGDAYFADPEFSGDPRQKAFVSAFRAKTGSYPIFAVSQLVAGLQAWADAHALAQKTVKGQWPSTERVADAMRGLQFRGLSRPMRIREDGQALQGQLMGITRTVPEYPFPIVDQLIYVPADLVATPVGRKSAEWIGTLSPAIVRSDRIRSIPASR